MLGDELSQYLFFSEEDHQVQIKNIPENHPLADYEDDNYCLDLKKYSETYVLYFGSHNIDRNGEKLA